MTSIKKHLSKKIMRQPWWLIAFVFVLSCSTTNMADLLKYYAPTAKLVLNQDLTIPAHSTGVYIQGAEVVTASARDQYHPNCRLIVKDLKTTPQVVTAETFDITHIRFDEDYVSSSMPHYASAGRYMMLSDGPSPQNYATEIYLNSINQPNVTKLVCAHWEDPTLANHLTPDQIRQTLGNIISFK